MADNYHVVPHDEGWAVQKENAERASYVFETKEKALARGRSLAREQNVELVIHRADGTIMDSDSYGNDPYPPADDVH